MESQVVVDLKGLERFIQQAKPVLQKVVKVAAFNVESRAKELVHIKTGATKASIYVSIAGQPSGYSQGVLAANALNPSAGITEPHAPEGDDGLSATIGPSTSYAYGLEHGTHNHQGYPFMRPALEQERQPFIVAVSEAMKHAGAV